MAAQPISFSHIEVSLPFAESEAERYCLWLKSIVREEHCFLLRLHYHFCSDDYLLEMNRRHLNHDYFTDIITFDDYRHPSISGDLFISTERVRDNAEKLRLNSLEELRRVMAHGLLHLIGYGDKGEEETRVMRKKEEEALQLWTALGLSSSDD